MNNMKNNNGKKIEHRLTALEVKMEQVIDNHLPHIEKKLDKLGTKFWAIIVLLITVLVTTLADKI